MSEWQWYLNWLHLSQNIIGHSRLPQNGLEEMQKRYPGEYIVEEYYDVNHQRFRFRLKFNSPEEESLWLLKFSPPNNPGE